MQVTVTIDATVNRHQLSMIEGESMAAKIDTMVTWLSDEFGVYASGIQTASGVVIELEEGAPADFIDGLASFNFY